MAKSREEQKICADLSTITMYDNDGFVKLTFCEIHKLLASLNLKFSNGQLNPIITSMIHNGKISSVDFFDMIKNWRIAIQEDKASQGQVMRSEKLFNVPEAVSKKNIFASVEIPQNKFMRDNNWSGSHQDSYCSESVGLNGPVGSKLRLITKFNPYGNSTIMACNKHNQMVGLTFSWGVFRLIVFDTECNIISVNTTGNMLRSYPNFSFAGGYFYMDNNGDSIVVGNNCMMKYPTNLVEGQIELTWKTQNLVEKVTGGRNNLLYASLPVWDIADMYWCLIAGKYTNENGVVTVTSDAHIAVVKVDSTNGYQGTVMDKLPLPGEYINNTFAVTEESAVFVTNGTPKGYCYRVSYVSGKIQTVWKYEVTNCGYAKVGQHNMGSGSTPTIMKDDSGRRTVVITDNASPKMNVVVFDYDSVVGESPVTMPVFQNMRSANEASVIGVNQSIFVENNFGHTIGYFHSQWVATQTGMTKLTVDMSKSSAELDWDQDRCAFIAMTMLARKSGILFAHSGEWDVRSDTEGAMYNIIAVDSYDGRVIWRVPIGRGGPFCHEFGGIYFDQIGDKIFMATNDYLISIQNL